MARYLVDRRRWAVATAVVLTLALTIGPADVGADAAPDGYQRFIVECSFSHSAADDPIVSQFLPFQPQMHGDVKHREARQIISTLTPYIQAAFLEKQSAEDALSQAADEVNRLLERG